MRRRKVALLAAGLVLALLAGLAGWRFGRSGALAPSTAVIRPAPPRPVAPQLAGAYREIERLNRRGDHLEAVRRYPAFLENLGRLWGPESRDLAPYYYDFALALKLCGRSRDSSALAARSLERWPGSLQLELLEATSRAEAALDAGSFDPRADDCYRRLLGEGKREENLGRLRGLGVEPATLFGQWAELLHRAARQPEALRTAEEGLALEPGNRACRETQARALLELERPREALPVLRALARETKSRATELYLGIALLNSGETALAWERFSPLLQGEGASGLPSGPEPLLPALRMNGARALSQLHRPAEAAELLLELLSRDPENAAALHELAGAARALGAREGGLALDGRIRRLQEREGLLRSAHRARVALHAGSVPYYRARAALEVQRTGEALELLEEAIRLSPRNATLYQEAARVSSLLSLLDAAERRLRAGLARCSSPLLAADLGRLLASRGEETEARKLLQPLPAPADRATALGRARALLELGEVEAAEASLALQAGENDEESALCCAEAAIRRGRVAEAAELLSGSFGELAGGSGWAGALRTVLRLRGGGESGNGSESGATGDPSDLLDHPRLLAALPPSSSGEWPARVLSAHQRRSAIVSRLGEPAGADLAPPLRELLALYREAGAERKARETAWYLVHLQPSLIEDQRRLAQTLSSPEEVVAKLSVLRSAFRLVPGDPEIAARIAEARALLGLR
jgi:predicted Zn-dependent protease